MIGDMPVGALHSRVLATELVSVFEINMNKSSFDVSSYNDKARFSYTRCVLHNKKKRNYTLEFARPLIAHINVLHHLNTCSWLSAVRAGWICMMSEIYLPDEPVSLAVSTY